MSQQSLLKAILVALVWTSVASCAGVELSEGRVFTPPELVGTWRANYAGIEYGAHDGIRRLTGAETLILRADGRYQQIYDDGKGYTYTSSWNKWYLESGRVLHLENGRIYPLGIAEAEKRAQSRGAICSYLSQIPGKGIIEVNCTEALLYVFGNSVAPGSAVLEHLQVGDPDAPKVVVFYRVSTLVATPL